MHFKPHTVPDQVVDNTQLRAGQDVLDRGRNVTDRGAFAFDSIDTGEQTAFRLAEQMPDSTARFLTDDSREGRVGLHTFIRDDQVKADDVTPGERLIGRYAVDDGIIDTDADGRREADLACAVG